MRNDEHADRFASSQQPGYAAMKMSRTTNFPITLIAIDGRSGSGKTTLAGKLAVKLNAEILHVDDFTDEYRPFSSLPLLEKYVFEPIQRGATRLSYPRLQYAIGEATTVEHQPVTPVMILEGVGSADVSLRPYVARAVLVETPQATRELWGKARDEAQRDRSDEENQTVWAIWDVAENNYFAHADLEALADITVRGDQHYDVDEICNRLMRDA